MIDKLKEVLERARTVLRKAAADSFTFGEAVANLLAFERLR
jgi:hypothetical protein